jgi:hypothetical protein
MRSPPNKPMHPTAPAARRLIGKAFGVRPPPEADRSILSAMKIATGKVVEGKVVVEGVTLQEGSSVTVLARDEEGGVTLTPEEEAELLLAIAEADRGETVSAEEVLAKLARRHG